MTWLSSSFSAEYHYVEHASTPLFFLVVFALGHILRLTAHRHLRLRHLSPALDFIATLELCTCTFEKVNVLVRYGFLPYCLVFFLLLLLYSEVWKDGGTTSPCTAWESLVSGGRGLRRTLISLAAMMAAALLSWHLARLIWGIGMSSTHATKYASPLCQSNLRTSATLGVLCEFAATSACAVLARECGRRYRNHVNYIMSAAVVAITVTGSHMTGCFFNPALATALTWRCSGLDDVTFILVYWLAPLTATTAVMALYGEIGQRHVKFKTV